MCYVINRRIKRANLNFERIAMKKRFTGHIVFEGVKFTIEWFLDDRGESQVRDYFNDLTVDRQDTAFYLFRFMGDIGKIFNIEKT
jgi:hypothetical protein